MSPILDEQPSLQEWKELFAAALNLKKIEPWTWMHDSDVFGVQSPVSGEIGYCCILGALGEVFAMAVYRGTEGLESYLKLSSGKVSGSEAAFIQKCLMASFEDRQALDTRDLQIIKQVGLKFRGRNAWVQFRSYEPGYYPWYITKEDAESLKVALEQACEVALMIKNDRRTLRQVKKGHYLVRVPETGTAGPIWSTQHIKPKPLDIEPQSGNTMKSVPVDEVRLQRLTGKPHEEGMIWEADLFWAPVPIREGGDRPFFPRVSLFVDHYSGYIFGTNLLAPHASSSGFLDELYRVLEMSAAFPEYLWVAKREAQELVKPICAKLKIKLKLVNRLSVVEAAKSSLFTHLSRGA